MGDVLERPHVVDQAQVDLQLLVGRRLELFELLLEDFGLALDHHYFGEDWAIGRLGPFIGQEVVFGLAHEQVHLLQDEDSKELEDEALVGLAGLAALAETIKLQLQDDIIIDGVLVDEHFVEEQLIQAEPLDDGARSPFRRLVLAYQQDSLILEAARVVTYYPLLDVHHFFINGADGLLDVCEDLLHLALARWLFRGVSALELDFDDLLALLLLLLLQLPQLVLVGVLEVEEEQVQRVVIEDQLLVAQESGFNEVLDDALQGLQSGIGEPEKVL